jgi:hypothetical protein
MTSQVVIRLVIFLVLLLLVSAADATCQTGFDYCANITISENTNLIIGSVVYYPGGGSATQILGLPLNNIEGVTYVNDNLSNVYINLTSNKYTLTYNKTVATFSTGPIFNIRAVAAPIGPGGGITEPSYAMICLNGSGAYSHPLWYGSSETYVTKNILSTNFNQYYRRNWTFYDDNGNLLNFTNKNSTLNIYCPTLGTFNYNLTSSVGSGGSLTIQTLEQPTYIANYQGILRTRSDTDHFLKGGYYLGSGLTQYQYTLVDYTSQCNGPLVIRKSINNTLSIIDLSFFDSSRIVYPFLDNNTAYDTIIYCRDGSYRDYGTFIQGSTIARNVEVTNLPINPAATKYSGGFTPLLLGNSSQNIISAVYVKTSGVVDSFNFTVEDISTQPATVVYNSVDTGLSSGEKNYNIDNNNHTYYAIISAVNDGQQVDKSQVYTPSNESLTSTTLPAQIAGIDSNWIYVDFVLLGLGCILLSGAAIDAYFVALFGVGWVLLFSLFPRLDGSIGWVSIPSWMQVILGICGLALAWGINRRHDE